MGINALKFCKEFNEFTKDLPSYFLLKVKITIMEDRSYSFLIFPPTIGFFLTFLKYQRIIKLNSKEIKDNCISLKNLVQLAKFKFPHMAISNSILIVLGTVNSCKIVVDYKL